MAKAELTDEREKFKSYLKSESSEDAKRPLLYPLFHKLFKDKFKIESDAHGADVYVEGKLIVEAKSDYKQWVEGFYQALHYQKKYGLTYNTIIVVATEFCGIWKVNKIPEEAILFHHTADAQKAPNEIGKFNAKRTQNALRKEIQDSAFYWIDPADLKGGFFAKNLLTESFEILKILKNLDSDRLQINTHNFIHAIERIKTFFEHPIDAVHAFYTVAAFWDITSTCAVDDATNEVRVIGFKGHKLSPPVTIHPHKINEFRKFIETQYIFTNEGSGLTVDYYFSRFDEVLAKVDPEYVKQHGIFFTNDNLSKFALWFVKENFSDKLEDNYIVFDPAGGSGNLVSSWRGKLRHKIISELQPDLLRIIERRMQVDPWHVEKGFTIIPKTSANEGLNFLDRSAGEYVDKLKAELKLKNIALDKPIAFLLNPPYKNTDENVAVREDTASEYGIHPSILKLTGEDAGKERYLAFLGQILNIAKEQVEDDKRLHPVVMIFTPTSWLIPRPTYEAFRNKWDEHFKFHSGIIVTSNEWFKLDGKWPLAFTIWEYDYNKKGNRNKIKVLDLTELKKQDLNINWNASDGEIKKDLALVLKDKRKISFGNKGDIRDTLPEIETKGKLIRQTRYDYSVAKKTNDFGKIVSGFPKEDKQNHFELRRKCGDANGGFIGFMDDCTPVRVKQDSQNRMSNKPDRVWFRLDNDFKGINKTKVFNGAADNRSYCAYDLDSAQATMSWFALSKALNGVYPVWANQNDIWAPYIINEKNWYSLCFAFVLAENRCVVTKFEKDNPVIDAPEVFVDNPLCPTNAESFWSKTLAKEISKEAELAKQLVDKITQLYKHWGLKHCKGQYLYNVGLHDEPYFKYFDYPDFLTPHSGLIQIKKYSEKEGLEDMLKLFSEVTELTKKVKAEIYRLLIDEFMYF